MKTAKEMLVEIKASEDLKREMASLENMEGIEVFLKKSGCNVAVDDFAKYVKTYTEIR